jgi:hypothetical protein
MIESSLHPSEPLPLPQPSLGRSLRSVAAYGLLTALMVVPPMLVFVPAALLHCALRHGRRVAWAAFVVAAVLASLYYVNVTGLTLVETKLLGADLAAVFLALALPALFAVPMVRRGESFGRVVLFLLIGGALGLAATELGARALASYSPYALQVAEVQQLGGRMAGFYRQIGMPAEAVSANQTWWAKNVSLVLPANLLLVSLCSFVLSLLMLGRLNVWRAHLARVEPPAAGVFLFRNLAFPDWLLFAFILGGLTPLTTGMLQKIAANTLSVVVVLYILQGLAIFRYVLVAMGAGFLGTALACLMLVLLMSSAAGPLLLGLAGLFDPFFDFRHFKKRKDDSHEGHTD